MYTTAQGFSYAALCPDIAISPLAYVSLSHSLNSALVHVQHEYIVLHSLFTFSRDSLQSSLGAPPSYQKSSESMAGSWYPRLTDWST